LVCSQPAPKIAAEGGGQQRIQHPSTRRLIDDLLQFVEYLPRHGVVDPAL
jgi:hypothetical protein